jgi:hypothetical protein
MLKSIFSRVYTTSGEIYNSFQSFKEYIISNEVQVITINLAEIEFTQKEDLIEFKINDSFLPFSMTGFKSICSLLKVPAAYLNKSLSKELVLQNLNNNPLKVDQEIYVYIRESVDKIKFISAVSVLEPYKYQDFLSSLEATNFLDENSLEFESVAVANEELTLYALKPEIVEVEMMQMQYGVAITITEGLDKGMQLSPFVRVHLLDHDTYDFVSSRVLKKVSSKEKSFAVNVQDLLSSFNFDELFAPVFDEIRKIIFSSLKSTEITYLFLKKIRSTIKRTYSFQEGVYDTSELLEDLLPEYRSFMEQYKIELKEKPKFETNMFMIPYYLPKLFSKYEHSVLNFENPLFYIRQRKYVYQLLEKNAESFYKEN